MRRPSRATYLRRRAATLLGLLVVALITGLAVRGDGDADPAGSLRPEDRGGASVTTGRPVRPRPQATPAAIAARATVPVLCWHQIRPLTGADAAQDRLYIVPPKTLDRQLGALKRAGYTSVRADQVADHMAKGTRLPPKPVLLTFDDASDGQYSEALPLPEKHGLKATFYVMTVVLGNQGWLAKGQVRKLDRAGMEIGVHTWDHHAVPEYAGDDWKVQLTEPKAELEQIVCHELDTFAYPFGSWSPAAFDHLRQAGIRVAFQLSDKLDRDEPMDTARRVLVGPDVSPKQLLGMVREDF